MLHAPFPAARPTRAPGSEPEPTPAAAPGGSVLDQEGQDTLTRAGIDLDPRDRSHVAAMFPNSFTVVDDHVFVTAIGDGAVCMRQSVQRLVAAGPVRQAARVYVLRPTSKGRAILIASRSGADSLLLDAGAGQIRADRSSAAVRHLADSMSRLVSSGTAAAPARVIVSHVDADHNNALREMLSRSEFSRTSVQIAAELISGRQTSQWDAMRIGVDRNRRVIEVRVTGGGGSTVHVHRQIYDGFVIHEFRSMQAHEDAAGNRRYNRNRTSPVSVVMDRATGERHVFTADAQPRQFSQMVDSMGERAFRRLIGGSAQNLRSFEYPHHGGAVSTGADVRGLLRTMWFVLEASQGQADVFTQTSPSFSARSSDSLRVLEDIGVQPRRVGGTADVAPAGSSTVDRITGATTETITVNRDRITRIQQATRPHQSDLRQGFAKLGEVNAVRAQYKTLLATMRSSGFVGQAQLAEALTTSIQQLDSTRAGLRTQLNAVRTALEQVAGNEMRAGAPGYQASVRTAVQTMARTARQVNLEADQATYQAHLQRLSLSVRMMLVSRSMMEASLRQDFSKLRAHAAELRRLRQQAMRVMGVQGVKQHLRTAWQQAGRQENLQRSSLLRDIYAGDPNRVRARRTATLAIAGQTLQRQLALYEAVASASHSGRQVLGPNGVPMTPMRTRVGALGLAVIEVARIGLEFETQRREANQAAEARLQADQLRGLSNAAWWTAHGADATLALVRRDWWSGKWTIVSDGFTQSQLQGIVGRQLREQTNQPATQADRDAPAMPEEARVVVRDVPDDVLLSMITPHFSESSRLADFDRWNSSNPEGPVFKRFDNGWGVKLWDDEDRRYKYFYRGAIQQPLTQLTTHLSAGTSQELARRRREEGVHYVKDTAWLGVDRYIFVYNRGGNLQRIDVAGRSARFFDVGTRYANREQMRIVEAADIETYLLLARYKWVEFQQGTPYDTKIISNNSLARALVPEDNLKEVTVREETEARAASGDRP